jgi:hypothetical protein
MQVAERRLPVGGRSACACAAHAAAQDVSDAAHLFPSSAAMQRGVPHSAAWLAHLDGSNAYCARWRRCACMASSSATNLPCLDVLRAALHVATSMRGRTAPPKPETVAATHARTQVAAAAAAFTRWLPGAKRGWHADYVADCAPSRRGRRLTLLLPLLVSLQLRRWRLRRR